MADTTDLKSVDQTRSCGFKSRQGHARKFGRLIGGYMRENKNWREKAACAGRVTNPRDDPFFPVRGDQYTSKEVKEKHCKVCPVEEECLQESISNEANFTYGIWGGTTAHERRNLRRIGKL